MLEHGGNLHEAIKRFNRPRHEWLDLSTGINPVSYSVPMLLNDAWHRLPETDAEFITAAQSYFGVSQLLAVAGTQVAIQALPRLRSRSIVIVAAPAYAEHAYRWAQAGHDVLQVPYEAIDSHMTECDVMVVCNPNNPTGITISAETLMRWAENLASRNGWLIVDEAFIDITPAASVATWSDHASLIVLRSIGKFFGLAGLRLGFVLANAQRLSALAEIIGPWAVSGPAQEIGKLALTDVSWQINMRKQLLLASSRLHTLLALYGIKATGTALFQWWPEPKAQAFWQHMAESGVWVRFFTKETNSIRLGLPHSEENWLRLETALATWQLKTQKSHFE